MKRVVMGIVDSPQQAELTVQRLVALGFAAGAVSTLYPDKHGDHDFGFEARTKAPEGALIGIGFGAIMGAMIGVTLGLAGAIPALAVLVQLGPVLAALSGAALGALILGVVGAVFGLFTPAIEARYYAGKTRVGSVLVGVHTRSGAEKRRAREVFRSVAASNVQAMSEAALPVSS